jgi:tetratricopeptide (TPR) repeat protein
MPRTIAGTPVPAEDSERKTLLGLYEKALTLMQSGKYDDAHSAFTALLEGAPHDLADRIRMYISACVSQIHQGTTEFRTHEERYDYAISLLNRGLYDDASEHFREILLAHEGADYAFYGLALLNSMVGRSHECLEHLAQAIHLNPQNRIQARGDSDFANMAEDPRFTDLLYPES